MSDVLLYLRASPEVLSMWPWKLSITSKFSCLLFWQPRPKNWNSEIVHQSLWSASQKHEETVRSYLLHSFFLFCGYTGAFAVCLSPATRKQYNYSFTKTIFLSQTSLLITAGDALSSVSSWDMYQFTCWPGLFKEVVELSEMKKIYFQFEIQKIQIISNSIIISRLWSLS
jgi:hypothetical protein